MRAGTRIITVPKEETLFRIIEALALTDREAARLRELAALIEPVTQARDWQQQLREARIAKRMPAATAARYAGVTVGTLRGWERRESGGASRQCLQQLLPHLGIEGEDAEAFLALVPSDAPVVRPPGQPTNPVGNLPAWSKFLTEKRLARGLYLADVDILLGQQSIIRRFELGGWARADGRLSVASSPWLDRIADALDMSADDRAQLHYLAERERIAVAAKGPGLFSGELFQEIRRAQELTVRTADLRLPNLPCPWKAYEAGDPQALRTLKDPDVVRMIIDGMNVGAAIGPMLVGVAAEPAIEAVSARLPERSVA